MKIKQRFLCHSIAAVVVSILAAGATRAASLNWDGSANGFWTNAANWDLNIRPTNGDALFFPGGVTQVLATNTGLSGAATNLRSLTLSGSNYVLVAHAPLSITNGLTNVTAVANITNTIRAQLVPRASQTWVTSAKSFLILSSNVNFTNLTLTLDNDGVVQFNGAISGGASSTLTKTNTGDMDISGAATLTQFNVNEGTVRVDGTLAGGLTIAAGAKVEGVGTIPPFTCAGTIAPGDAGPGTLTVSAGGAAAVFSAGSTFSVQINGATPDTGYDQLKVSFAPTLTGATLQILLGYSPMLGDSFVIITNTGAGAFATTFSGLPEGATQTVSHVQFRVSYVGGTGNDVTLTVVGITATGVTKVWSGGAAGADANWLNATNWSNNIAPVIGDSLVFPAGLSKLNVTNNFPAGSTFDQVVLGNSGYDLLGNSIRLMGGISATQASGFVNWELPVTFTGAATARVDQAASTLNFLAALSLNGQFTADGGGDLFAQRAISGAGGLEIRNHQTVLFNSNNFSGATRVVSGSLDSRNNNSLGVASPTDDTLVDGSSSLEIGILNSVAEPLRLMGALTLNGLSSWTGPITLSGSNILFFTFMGGTGTISGPLNFTDAGAVRVSGQGGVILQGPCSGPARPTFLADAGTFRIETVLSAPLIINGGSIEGTGEVGDITIQSPFLPAGLRPGSGSGGVLTCSNISYTGGGKLFQSDLISAGVFGQLRARSTVQLGGPLAVNAAFVPAFGSVFTIIDNQGASSVNGTFVGLPEGSTITTNGLSFRISYMGGDGNDVTLTLTGVTPTGVTRIWDGGGVNNLWSNPTNWVGDVLPVAGDSILFPSTLSASDFLTTNDLPAGMIFDRLIVRDGAGGGNTFLRGNAIALMSGLLATNTSGAMNVNLPLLLTGAENFTPGATLSLNGPITLNGDLTFDGTANVSTTVAGSISGSGGLIKTFPGALLLQVSNSFNGPVQILAGSVEVDHSFGLGAPGGGTFVGTNSTLLLVVAGALAENSLSITGNVVAIGTNVIPGQVTLTRSSSPFNVGAGSLLTLTGTISGPGGPHLFGGGVCVLTGTNDCTGNTTVDNGTLLVHGRSTVGDLNVNSPGVLGGTGVVGRASIQNGGAIAPGASPGILTSSNVSFFSSSTLQIELNGTAAGLGYDQLNVNGMVVLSGAQLTVALNFSPPFGFPFVIINNDGVEAVTGTFNGLPEGVLLTTNGVNFRISYIGGDGNDVTLTRVLIPSGVTRVWDGGGANNSWTNRTNWVGDIAPLEGDSLVFPVGAARKLNTNDFPALTGFNSIIIGDGAYILHGAAVVLNGGLNVTNSGTPVISFPVQLNASQTNSAASGSLVTWNGTFNLGANTLTFNGAGLQVIAGVISGSGGLAKSGSGSVSLNATNTYQGLTSVQQGVLNANTSGALGDAATGTFIARLATLQFNGGLTVAEPLMYDSLPGGFAFVQSVSGTNTLTGPISVAPDNFASALTVLAGELRVNAVISGGGLYKSGGGRAVFNANNTLTNNIHVAQGSLIVNGSQPASLVLLDASDSFLGGTGTVGTVSASSAGGTLSPGASPGLLTIAGNFNATSTLTNFFELNGNVAGASYDQLVFTGDIFLNGSVLKLVFGYTPAFGDLLTLIRNDTGNPVTGTFAGLPEGSLITNGPAVMRLSYLGGDGNDVTLSRLAVPTGVTRVWTGLAANNNWSTEANWTFGIAPSPGDDVVFPAGTPRLSPIYNAGTNVPFNTITFGDAYNLSPLPGHTLHLIAGLTATNTVTTARVFVPITLDSNQTWTVTQPNRALQASQLDLGFFTLTHAGPGNLALAGSVTGQGGLVGNSPGILGLSGTNSFAGAVIVNAGTLQLSSTGGLGSSITGTFIGSSGTLSFDPPAGQTVNEPLTLAGTFANVSSIKTNTWAGPITMAGSQARFHLNGGQVNVDGPVAGAGFLTLGGAVALNAANAFTGPVRVGVNGTLLANGTLPGLTVGLTNGSILGGTGVVGQVSGRFCIVCGVAPARLGEPGLLTTGDLDLQDAQYFADLNGPTPGSGYDQISVQGTVKLTGANLTLNTGFTPAPGQTFTLINNDGADPVVGNFIALPQGRLLTNNGVVFQISYTGGDGNDVTLTTSAATASTIQFSGLNSNGLFSLTGRGVTNTAYVIEATPHLDAPIPWQPISTNTSDGAGLYQFTDLVSTNFPMRFYRVRSP